MFLEELQTVNFRNLTNQTTKLKKGLNVFYGDNAQGKTNILEAVYILSTGKSFRTRSDLELINWSKQEAKLKARVDNLEPEVFIYQDKKEFLINKQKHKMTDLIGRFLVVLFTPSDIEIVSGSPDKRRRYLDQIGATLDKKYLHQLLLFNKVMRSRNQLLFQIKQGRQVDLSVWDEQLVKAASYLWHARLDIVQKVNLTLKNLNKKLTKTKVELDYKQRLVKETRNKTENSYLALLKQNQTEDIKRTTTKFGPHRDDFQIIAEDMFDEKITSKDLTIYGSRGEQRAVSLALKIAEVNLIEEETNAKPVLLLDEVFSELDREHRTLLLKHIRNMQTLVTSTNTETLEELTKEPFNKYEVKNGTVS